MLDLRRFLLVLVFFAAQWVVGAHAFEHGADGGGVLPEHACELCLAAHDLGAAMPSLEALPPVAPPGWIPENSPASGRCFLPAPGARQGAPPDA
ncbi:MAG TPA: hypothetical protein PKD04_00325 [Rhodocyclaceae bacterium]|jgi:hypothetical protein|nr:hypothetical protein [Betaproteobacteria bacterium]HMU99490.1 hypothetical protein [Rhodocyclaceae bacterium]HMV21890.1 hypothetical protein [Rhodocyclaceae bacterium]HMW77324.1 hypothetical protein [Rhodocyclaceae bacterium]HNL20599.1 hypothetical protein [Rhodocyclaceae bacterium]